MQFERGNKAIRDHAIDGKDLLLFKSLGKGKPVRYEGQFNCTSWEERPGPDKNGTIRRIIVFHLVRADQDSPSLDHDIAQEWESLPIEQLRNKANEAAQSSASGANPREGRRNYHQCSEAVKAYVLARANGICEACKQPAPFKRTDGTPYLEPHHTRRVSDGGPDHPQYVGAICPTCHRRIHHGMDGTQVNEALISYIAGLEA